jgi:hypothetical protein
MISWCGHRGLWIKLATGARCVVRCLAHVVEDTHHIDPRTFTLEPDASGRPRWVQILVRFAFVRQFSDWLATAALIFGIIGLIGVFPAARRSARSVSQTLPTWGVSAWEAGRASPVLARIACAMRYSGSTSSTAPRSIATLG